MPPKFSKPIRTEHSASADQTPCGFRNPRGQKPQHTPRCGCSEFSDRRQPRDKSHLEQRTRIIEDAFHADIDPIRTNNLCFTQCIAQVLRKQSGIRTNEDHDAALADYYFEPGSRHMSYIFRHTNLLMRTGPCRCTNFFITKQLLGKLEPCIEKDFNHLFSWTLVKFLLVSETGTIQCDS